MEQTTEHSATVCPYSILPYKYGPAVNDATNKNDSKYHYDAYNYNTRTGFRDHNKIFWWRVLSSTLLDTVVQISKGHSRKKIDWIEHAKVFLQVFQPLWYPEVRMEEVVWLKSYPQLEIYPAEYPSFPMKGISTRWTTTPSVEVEVEVWLGPAV